MTQTARTPGYTELDPAGQKIAVTVRSSAAQALVVGANDLELARQSLRWTAYNLPAGSGPFSFPLRFHPSARYARLAVWWREGSNGFPQPTLALSITDGVHTVPASDARIPVDFQGGSLSPGGPFGYNDTQDAVPVAEGILDLSGTAPQGGSGGGGLAQGAPALAGTDWIATLTVGAVGGLSATAVIDRIEVVIYPRDTLDDVLTDGGETTASLGAGMPIAAGNATGSGATPWTDGWLRYTRGLDRARLHPNVPVALSWPQDITQAIPRTADASGTPVALTNWTEGGGVAAKITTRVRRLYAASAQGEPHRYRVLYRFAGGAGVETAKVRLATGSSSSPFDLAGIAYTTAWTWSAWQTCYLKTNGANQLDACQVLATLSAAGPTFYLAGLDVESAPA